MQKALTLYDTTIGKKAVMGLTGLVMFGFVIGHMLGNLQIFGGAAMLNSYAHKLKVDFLPLLLVARVVLSVSLIAHLVAAFQLSSKTAGARSKGYRVKKHQATNYSAMTMMLSGPILLLFIIFHLAHFTFPGVALGAYTHSHTDVFNNVVSSFKNPPVTAVYVAAQVFVGLHLYHGSWSLMQTLGFNHPRYNAQRKAVAQAFAAIVTVGNIFIPLGVLAGLAG